MAYESVRASLVVMRNNTPTTSPDYATLGYAIQAIDEWNGMRTELDNAYARINSLNTELDRYRAMLIERDNQLAFKQAQLDACRAGVEEPDEPDEPDPPVDPTGYVPTSFNGEDGEAVTKLWVGGVTSTGFRAAAKLRAPATNVRLVASETANFTGKLIASDPVGSVGEYVLATVNGLRQGVRYYWAFAVGGVLYIANKGRCKLVPPAGAPASFRFGAGSCSNGGINSGVWKKVLAETDPILFWQHTGDKHYRNTTTDSALDLMLDGLQGRVFAEIPVNEKDSDHDFCGNASDSLTVRTGVSTRDQAVTIMRKRAPNPPYAFTGPLDVRCYFYRIGRFRFVVTDDRSRKINGQRMWDDAQKTWIGQQIDAAKAAKEFVLLIFGEPMSGTEFVPADRVWLANKVKASKMVGRTAVISGDAHSIYLDDGRHHDYATGGGAPLPIIGLSPIHSSNSVKGGPYSHGTYMASGNGGYESAGIITVTDNGGDDVRLDVLGFAGSDGRTLVQFPLVLSLTGWRPVANPKVAGPIPVVEKYPSGGDTGTPDDPPVDPPVDPDDPEVPDGTGIKTHQSDMLVEFLGMNIHANFGGSVWTETTEWRNLLGAMGIRYHRTSLGTLTSAQAIFNDLHSRFGMRGLINVGRFSTVNGVTPTFNNTEVASFLDFVRDKIGTDRIIGVEAANESNKGATAGWADRVRAVYAFIEQRIGTDPAFANVPIVGPSIFDRITADYTALGDMSNLIDVTNLHNYTGGRKPTLGLAGGTEVTLAKVIADARKPSVGKPLWVTEMNHDVADSTNPLTAWVVPQEVGARYLLRHILDLFRSGCDMAFIYAMLDQLSGLPNYGVAGVTGSGATATVQPRPSYYAVKNFVAANADPGPQFAPKPLDFTLSGDTAGIFTVATNRRNGAHGIWIYNDASLYDRNTKTEITVAKKPVTLNLATPRKIETYDPHTNTTQLISGTAVGSATIQVPPSALLVRLT